ncbi:hypothetical protein B0H11DRAFT_1978807 [Mycena galericulata]|nr:hypothetical protein B0H11DRAFT_1978807 [Mycena galericulata]
MSIPELGELQAAATKMVHQARREGKLQLADSYSIGHISGELTSTQSDTTFRIIRQTLERTFSLPDGALNTKEYKKPLKKIIAVAVEEMESGSPSRPAASSYVEEMESAHVEAPVRNAKKRKSEEVLDSKPTKKQNTKPQKPKESSTKFKTPAMVPSSDVEEDTEAQEFENSSVEPEKLPSSEGSAKVRNFLSVLCIPFTLLQENRSKPAKGPENRKEKASAAKSKPRPSASSKPNAAADSGDKPKASKGKQPELSKDEETIKRLKSLVVACGVRKVWTKVFKDVDSASQQIRMLKEILTDLGMSGRMSLDQARAIKQKRELAQELEDVQAFAAAATRSKPAANESDSEEEAPAKRKMNARRNINDFLGDQSDED